MRRQLVGRLATRCETFACVRTVIYTPLELVIMPMISTASRRQARSNSNTFFSYKVWSWTESMSDSTSEILAGYGGGSGVREDVNGVEDNEDMEETSEKSEVQLGQYKPGSEP